jgi:two-component system chemotaxis sensor kinase CheA
MSADTDHARRIRELFREEAAEHLETLHAALREARSPRSRTNSLERALRAAHSLKGGAAIAGMAAIGVVVHDFESCTTTLLSGKVDCDDEALDLLSRVLDGVSDELSPTSGPSDGAALGALVDTMRGRFGAHCQINEIAPQSGEDADPQSVAPAAQLTVRIATERLDRQMAGIEELLRLKVGAEQRLLAMARAEDSLELVRSAVNESKQLARALARNAAAGSGAARLFGSFEQLSRLTEAAAGSLFGVASDIRQATHTLSSLTDVLHGDVRALRIMPLDGLFAPFSRAVRDLCRRTGKRASLLTSGGSTEVDRDVIEAVKDPVMHLIRNAVDHGIETLPERRAAGKPEEGVIQLHASTSAGMLEMEIVDDGRGVDTEEVGRVAVERRLVTAEQLSQMDDEAVRSLIFQDGFSTASELSELSGRGVGLAVVRNTVERLGGRVSVATREGLGTSFKLYLPLNLTTSRLLLVEVSGELFAIPALSVERVLRVEATSLSMVDHGFAFDLDGKPVGIHGLAEALGLDVAPGEAARHFVVVLSTASGRGAFVVDRIIDELPLVARNLGDHLADVEHVSGAAVLADGSVAPILNASELVRAARTERTGVLRRSAGETARVLRRVLVVDDSVTTRTLEKSILEAAGYEVEVAVDGAEALERLGRRTFDLVLSDVQMPRVDGLSLTRRMKQDPRWSSVPVVLVSSLDAAEQKKEGLDAGADAYLSKGDFEQGILLATLERFL